MKYAKPTLDLEAQIALLRQRGLVIPDENRARHYLRFIGYYRLSGYALPFQIDQNADGQHLFQAGVNFEDILDLYVFDRHLRLVVMNAVERIEVAFRTLLSQVMSERQGPHWFMDSGQFVPHFHHTEFMARAKNDIGQGNLPSNTCQVFIKHYYQKYGDPELPPSWMLFEALSLGTVSHIYKHLTRQNQRAIARPFPLDAQVLGSWMHALTYLRNLAAHHQRLWNRIFTIKPVQAQAYFPDLRDNTKFYAQAVMTEVLLKVVSPETRWGEKLVALLSEHPRVDPGRLGFPEDWRQRSVWMEAACSRP